MIFFLSYHEFDEFGGCDNVVENNEQKYQFFVDKSLQKISAPSCHECDQFVGCEDPEDVGNVTICPETTSHCMVSVNEGTGKVFRRWDKHFNILSDNLIHLLSVYFCQDIVFLFNFTLTHFRCGQAAETAEQCESSIDLSLNLVSNYFIFQSWFEYCQQLFYISILV